MKRVFVPGMTLALLTAALLAAPLLAGAAQADRTGERDVVIAVAAPEAVAKKPRWAKCNVKPDRPHWSKGAKSVIFKTRVSCRGQGIPHVSVYVQGTLGFVSGGKPGKCAAGPPSTAATSKQSQTIKVNGATKTYYTPLAKGKKVKRTGTYTGRVSARITSPLKSNIGSASSQCNYVKVP